MNARCRLSWLSLVEWRTRSSGVLLTQVGVYILPSPWRCRRIRALDTITSRLSRLQLNFVFILCEKTLAREIESLQNASSSSTNDVARYCRCRYGPSSVEGYWHTTCRKGRCRIDRQFMLVIQQTRLSLLLQHLFFCTGTDCSRSALLRQICGNNNRARLLLSKSLVHRVSKSLDSCDPY